MEASFINAVCLKGLLRPFEFKDINLLGIEEIGYLLRYCKVHLYCNNRNEGQNTCKVETQDSDT